MIPKGANERTRRRASEKRSAPDTDTPSFRRVRVGTITLIARCPGQVCSASDSGRLVRLGERSKAIVGNITRGLTRQRGGGQRNAKDNPIQGQPNPRTRQDDPERDRGATDRGDGGSPPAPCCGRVSRSASGHIPTPSAALRGAHQSTRPRRRPRRASSPIAAMPALPARQTRQPLPPRIRGCPRRLFRGKASTVCTAPAAACHREIESRTTTPLWPLGDRIEARHRRASRRVLRLCRRAQILRERRPIRGRKLINKPPGGSLELVHQSSSDLPTRLSVSARMPMLLARSERQARARKRH